MLLFSLSDVNVSIPLVCVVLEGGPGTLETVKSAIKNGTPAVIVEVRIVLNNSNNTNNVLIRAITS